MPKSYQPFTLNATPQVQSDKMRLSAQIQLRGTDTAPAPPRDVQCQSGARKVLLTWKLPERHDDITRWRIYRDTESNLAMEVADKGTRQMFMDVTAGATPPVVNFFVSALNAMGTESRKVQMQGSALAEASAPADPALPPGYTEEASGGGYIDSKWSRICCFTGPVEIETPAGLQPFSSLPSAEPFAISNKTGTHMARLVVHEDFQGWMIELADTKLVTLDHFMQHGAGWVPANSKYPSLQRRWFEGTVYNLHVLSENECDQHYVLFNGDVAHNMKATMMESDQ